MSTPPTLPPVKDVSKLKGKTIAYIADGLSFPFTQTVLSGVKAGAEVLGMPVSVTDSTGVPSTAEALVLRAVSQGASAILVQGVNPYDLTTAMQRAKAAHVPVVTIAALNAGPPPPTLVSAGLLANASFDYADVGRRLADFVVANSNGHANIGFISSSSFVVAATTENAFMAELRRLCPACPVTVDDSTLTQWQTGLGPLTRSMLLSHPNINYVVPEYDSMNLYVKAALAAAGDLSKVKIASENASLLDMKAVANPSDPEYADVGSPEAWLGWAGDDQIVRELTGSQPVASEGLPNRTFTKQNISQIPLNAAEARWYESVDFAVYYTKLWTGR